MRYGGKDLWKRRVLSLEWNTECVMEGEIGDKMEYELERLPEKPFIEMSRRQREYVERFIRVFVRVPSCPSEPTAHSYTHTAINVNDSMTQSQ